MSLRSTLQATRASLLASATASLFLCNRSDAVVSHAPKPYRAQWCGRIRSTLAAWINNVRNYLLPRLKMRSRIERPPVLYCRVTRPSQAAKSRPRSKASPVAIEATMPVQISGPTPWNTHQPLALGLGPAELFNLGGDGLNALVQGAPVLIEITDQPGRSRRDLFLSLLQYCEQRVAEGTQAPSMAMPCSIRKAHIWLIVAVRRETNRERTRWHACRSS